MSDLEYSLDAKNILNEFYEVERILYVEGVDDKVFWGTLFDKYFDKSIEIIEVDGLENLKPYIEQVENFQITNAYIACDQDYGFFKEKEWHERVICTFGHSIENSLISKDNICDVVRGFSKSTKKNLINEKFDSWFIEFKRCIADLIYCDIHNEKNKLGLSIIGDNCDRFLVKKSSFILNEESISEHVSKFFTQEEVSTLRSELESIESFILPSFIRGHFLFSAAMKFVTVLSSELAGKNINIAKDAFFSNIFISFEKNLENHPHSSYYESKISKLC